MVPDCYFVPLSSDSTDVRYLATEHTGGAWSLTEQHIAPLTGLGVHVIERHLAALGLGDGKAVGRVTFDILGVVPIEEVTFRVSVVRPGRSIDLVEAVASCRGRDVLVVRAWRMATGDTTSVAGGPPTSMPAPVDVPAWDMTAVWPGGFIASIDVRRTADSAPGRATAWIDTPIPLVADEPVSTLARFIGLVDTANGIGVRESPREWMFPNLDLSVHLFRQPVPGPVGIANHVTFGPDGLGLTSSVLHDVAGPVGRAAQSLTVRRLG
ncbi:thioesterase family protein [Nocardioides mangrovi]|uniref:Thioesterase family protein n=1 Tax=Nocardioides mangrovi TaxID=2874580 RepID=A0ABS7UJ56_9ACTN|nr:thioesterase family protein [Nocardioides mangrovi]MBZ5740622.1 thioesterase family protein [Nocardioides mangrovi]